MKPSPLMARSTLLRSKNVRTVMGVTLRGFVGTDFMHLREQFASDMTAWLKDGRVKYRETIHDGIENAPKALIGMLNGANTGKMLVKLSG